MSHSPSDSDRNLGSLAALIGFIGCAEWSRSSAIRLVTRKIRASLLLAFCCVLAVNGLAQGAQVIYNSFGPSDSFDAVNGIAITGGVNKSIQSWAEAFMVPSASNYSFVNLALPLRNFTGFGDTGTFVQVSLTTDAAGLPGTPLESFVLNLPSPSAGTIYSLNSASNPVLSAGQQYWVVTEADDPLGIYALWQASPGTHTDPEAISFDNSTWTLESLSNPFTMAFQVTAQAVPEPSTLVLAAFGFVGLAAWAWRRRR